MNRIAKRSELEGLRAEIRKLADEGRAANARIREKLGSERAAERRYKARTGSAAREALLAYGFLRGRPYAEMEARTSPDTHYHWIAGMVAVHALAHSPEEARPSAEDMKSSVKAWMGMP